MFYISALTSAGSLLACEPNLPNTSSCLHECDHNTSYITASTVVRTVANGWPGQRGVVNKLRQHVRHLPCCLFWRPTSRESKCSDDGSHTCAKILNLGVTSTCIWRIPCTLHSPRLHKHKVDGKTTSLFFLYFNFFLI